MRYTPEHIQFITDNIKGRSRKEMAAMFYARFGIELSYNQIHSFIKNHKLKSEIQYTQEQMQFIADHIEGRSYRELTDMFNEHFATNKKIESVTHAAIKRGLHNGIDGRLAKGTKVGEASWFKKGHIPWTKGKKGLNTGGKATQFKKGQHSLNYMPVGSERINGDGYVDVKIADPNIWKAKHRIIWEEAHGPVPEGYRVIFADKNRLNVTLDNLLLVHQRQLSIMNRKGLISTDAELTKTGRIIASIYLKISERKRK